MQFFDSESFLGHFAVAYIIIGCVLGSLSYLRTIRWYSDYVNNGGRASKQEFDRFIKLRSIFFGCVWFIIFKTGKGDGILSSKFEDVPEEEQYEFTNSINKYHDGRKSY